MTNITPTPCPWPGQHADYIAYHDNEWGVPEYDARALFEKLMLDGFQAGLSWLTILRKRDNLRAAFDGFTPQKIARYGKADIERLMKNDGIIRHRGKIESTITGARAWLAIMEKKEGFTEFCWQHVNGTPIQNQWRTMAEVPSETPMSRQLSKALKQAGFKFCGPVIVYAFAQAVGMVNDHLIHCPRHSACANAC
ncbi:MAG: DNA-3-methyladenine glycosylase I [Alphaproteobacteria bacterium]|nr:DNA-3-methyladenine glycosylase I [Alphaproteobacteria bacterium]